MFIELTCVEPPTLEAVVSAFVSKTVMDLSVAGDMDGVHLEGTLSVKIVGVRYHSLSTHVEMETVNHSLSMLSDIPHEALDVDGDFNPSTNEFSLVLIKKRDREQIRKTGLSKEQVLSFVNCLTNQHPHLEALMVLIECTPEATDFRITTNDPSGRFTIEKKNGEWSIETLKWC